MSDAVALAMTRVRPKTSVLKQEGANPRTKASVGKRARRKRGKNVTSFEPDQKTVWAIWSARRSFPWRRDCSASYPSHLQAEISGIVPIDYAKGAIHDLETWVGTVNGGLDDGPTN